MRVNDRAESVFLALANRSHPRLDILGLSSRFDMERARIAISGGPGARWFLGYRLLLGLSHDDAIAVSRMLNEFDEYEQVMPTVGEFLKRHYGEINRRMGNG